MQALCLVFSEPFLAVLTKRKPDGVPPGFIYLKNKKFLISFPVFLVFPVSEAILCGVGIMLERVHIGHKL